MTNTETIEIPLKKLKLLRYIFGTSLLLAAGASMLISKSTPSSYILRLPYVKDTVCIAGILLFGTALYIFIRKFFGNKNAVVINEQGIFDYTTIFSRLISWEDMVSVTHNSIMGKPFLMIIVKNPEVYIARERNILRRSAMRSNFKRYGSPIQVAGLYMKCDLEELRKIIEARLTVNGVV